MTLAVNTSPPSPLDWHQRLRAYALLVRFHRPIGSLLLLWPALWALWLAAQGQPPWRVVLIFIAGVFLMRSAGCAINDFADRNLDGQVLRTRERPLATGLVSPREALGVFFALGLAAFLLVLLLDWKTIALSVVALGLAVLYPFMKRVTHWPQVFLGAAFGWAVPMAYTAVAGQVPLQGWLVFTAALIWALIYDTQYAMVDREDDRKAGIKSTAILFGRHDRLLIGLLQLVFLGLMAYIGLTAGRGGWYFSGLAVAAGLSAYQQYLMRDRELAACFRAFLNNNYLGLALFLGLFLDYALS
ncbi:MAG: 4-hydroxybenzoate octaprenyltransferase [Chromatiaceae bacterium]